MPVTIDLSNYNKALNPIYEKALWDNNRFLVLMGGAGSGKSVFAQQKHLFRIFSEQNHRFLYCRKYKSTLRETVFAEIKNQLHTLFGQEIYNMCEISKSEFKVRFPMVNSEIFCVGLDDIEKIKSITGITGIFIEEATEVSKSDLFQLNLRLRGQTSHPKQIVLAFNPVSVTHWLKSEFFDKPYIAESGRYKYLRIQSDPNAPIYYDATVLRTTYKDNKFIDPEYASIIEGLASQNPSMYQVYGLGEWGVLKGLIYDAVETVNFADYPSLEDCDKVIYGLDFGSSAPTALIQCRIKGSQVWLKEMLYQTDLTTKELVNKLPDLIHDSKYKTPYLTQIIADSAEPDRIQEIRQSGWNIIPAHKGQNSIVAGIMFCKSLKLYTCHDNVNLNKELNGYSWALDKDEKPLDKPALATDHLLDAMRYALHTKLRRYGNTGSKFLGLTGKEVLRDKRYSIN